MSKEQHAKKYIEIPGEKTVIHNFHFDMTLPSPVPHPKTLYLPLDPERYIKPKTTLFHVKRKAAIMTDMDLSISAEDVNMHPEQYNLSSNTKPTIPTDITELIDEIVPKPIKPATPVPQKKQANGDKEPVLVKSLSSSKSETAKAEGKIEPFDLNKKKEEKLSLEEYINRGFENVKNIKVGSKHPKKDKVTCEQVFSVVPNFKEIISEFYILKMEAASGMLKEKTNIMKFENDVDSKPILSVSLEKPLFEDKKLDENLQTSLKKQAQDPMFDDVKNFEHFGNFIYSIITKKGDESKKELLFNLNKSEKKAYIYQPSTIHFKKKKVIFNAAQKEDDQEESSKEKKLTRIMKKKNTKEDLVLRKKKYEEMRLNNLPEYKDIQKTLENFEDEHDKLDLVKKRIVEVEDEVRQKEREKRKDENERKEDNEDNEEREPPEEKKKNKLYDKYTHLSLRKKKSELIEEVDEEVDDEKKETNDLLDDVFGDNDDD